MTETQDKKHNDNSSTSAKAPKPKLADLEAKRAKNLRENLMKRKLQARARDQDNPAE